MKKLLGIVVLCLLLSSISYSDIKSNAREMMQKARTCYFSLPSYGQDGAIDHYLDAMKYFNDAVKEDNMNDPRGLASIFYRNAIAYAGIVLQVGNAWGSPDCW